jgi:hypothetical protein
MGMRSVRIRGSLRRGTRGGPCNTWHRPPHSNLHHDCNASCYTPCAASTTCAALAFSAVRPAPGFAHPTAKQRAAARHGWFATTFRAPAAAVRAVQRAALGSAGGRVQRARSRPTRAHSTTPAGSSFHESPARLHCPASRRARTAAPAAAFARCGAHAPPPWFGCSAVRPRAPRAARRFRFRSAGGSRRARCSLRKAGAPRRSSRSSTAASPSAYVRAAGAPLPDLAAPRPGSPLPHLRRNRARPCRICAGTGLTPTTSALRFGSPLPHLHPDWAHPCHICTGTGGSPRHICAATGLTPLASTPGGGRSVRLVRRGALLSGSTHEHRRGQPARTAAPKSRSSASAARHHSLRGLGWLRGPVSPTSLPTACVLSRSERLSSPACPLPPVPAVARGIRRLEPRRSPWFATTRC